MSLKMCHFQYIVIVLFYSGEHTREHTYKYVKDILVWWSIQPTSHSMLKTVTRTIRGGQPCELTNNVYQYVYICAYTDADSKHSLGIGLNWNYNSNNFNLFFAVPIILMKICVYQKRTSPYMCRNTNWQQNVHIHYAFEMNINNNPPSDI